MSKPLIIAEKPELARSIAEALNVEGKEIDGVLENNQYQIVSAFGHLLQLKEPEDIDEKYKDRNDLTLLPVYFKNWEKVPTKDRVVFGKKQDNSYIRKRLQKIGTLLANADTVIHAGDPDDEGQLLIDEILQYFHYQGKVLRVLLNDNLKENIQKQIHRLEENSKYIPIGNAAYARQMADMCFGISHSRLASIRLNKPLTIGRVQSPTLNLVVVRDEQIERHEKRKYYALSSLVKCQNHKIRFIFQPSKEFLDGEDKVFDRKKLEHLYDNKKGKEVHIHFQSKVQEQQPPLPYNATELQADMNGKYGYSLSETLKITQTLRDKYKAITYNRSDCQYLKEEHYEEAPHLLPTILKNLGESIPVDPTIHARCFDDKKVSAHHAIIPQNRYLDLSQLSEKEKNVYVAICLRYLIQFLPNLRKNVCKGRFHWDENGEWEYSSSYIVDQGYQKYLKKEMEEAIQPFFNTGEYVGVISSMELEEKETNPPKRYTPQTLIKDMCSISKYVQDPKIKSILQSKDKGKEGEHGSIGTVATRADIIDKLLKRGYLEMKGKSIQSTTLGKEFCHMLPEEIKSPDTTAKWWLMQEEIKKGKDPNLLLRLVVQDFLIHKETAYKGQGLSKQAMTEKEDIGECPICGKPVYKAKSKNKKDFVYFCSGYKEGCSFIVSEHFKRFNDVIHITDYKMKQLLNHKTIKESLTTKDGKQYEARLSLDIVQVNGKYYTNLKVNKSNGR